MTGGPRPRSFARAVTAAAVAGTGVALHRLGTGPLAAPPLGSWSEIQDWATSRSAVEIALALVRLGALGAAAHLALTTGMALAGRLFHLPALARAAHLGTLPPFRGLVRRAAGLALSASALVPASSPAMVIQRIAPAPVVSTGVVIERIRPGPAPQPGGSATMSVQPPGSATVRTIENRSEPKPPAPVPDPRHLVRPGDHLWAIAEQDLTRVLGRAPTGQEIAPRWRAVMAANPQLADPDLLFPGTYVVVPPISPPVSPSS